MNILITGIHGFVGSNLVEYLKGKHALYGLDIVAPEKDGVIETFQWTDVDNTERGLPQFDVMILKIRRRQMFTLR